MFALAALIAGTAMNLTAQPTGWPCDYGYRPGNTWFYRSVMFPQQTFNVTVVRDSMGSDGMYWACYRYSDVPENITAWYRIDSSCMFDVFLNPHDVHYQRWFVAAVDSGDSWIVDSAEGQPSTRAFISDITPLTVFGKPTSAHEVLYSFDERPGVNWYRAEVWAEGIGRMSIRTSPGGYDVLIGAIIDGRKYGTTSDVEELPTAATEPITVFPSPTNGRTTLRFYANGQQAAIITVHDMLGRQVLQTRADGLHEGANTVPLDLGALPQGSYLLLLTLEGTRRMAPLIIAR